MFAKTVPEPEFSYYGYPMARTSNVKAFSKFLKYIFLCQVTYIRKIILLVSSFKSFFTGCLSDKVISSVSHNGQLWM